MARDMMTFIRTDARTVSSHVLRVLFISIILLILKLIQETLYNPPNPRISKVTQKVTFGVSPKVTGK